MHAWFMDGEISNGRLGASYYCSVSVVFGYSLPPLGTADLVTQKLLANEHPLPANVTYPVGPSASSFNFSTAQKPRTAQYQTNLNKHYILINSSLLQLLNDHNDVNIFCQHYIHDFEDFWVRRSPPSLFLLHQIHKKVFFFYFKKQETVCWRQISAGG